VTQQEVLDEVGVNPKQRFQASGSGGDLRIRALQGHTAAGVTDAMHERITCIGDLGGQTCVVHGTFLRQWMSIRTQGLGCMGWL